MWEPLAQLVLDASYEATVLATIRMIANKRASARPNVAVDQDKETSEISGETLVLCRGDEEATRIAALPDEDSPNEASSECGTERTPSLKSTGREPHRLYLTFLGGGVFRNEPEWIARAVGRALAVAACTEDAPEIVICHFRKVSERMKNLIDEAYSLELEARKQR